MARKHANTGKKEGATERRIRVFDMRKAGWSYRKIADKEGVSEAQAFRDVQTTLKELKKLEHESAEEYRQMELERLDMLLEGLEPYAKVGNVGSVLAFLRVSESRRKLLGLDAPEKRDVTSDGKPIPLAVIQMSMDDL